MPGATKWARIREIDQDAVIEQFDKLEGDEEVEGVLWLLPLLNVMESDSTEDRALLDAGGWRIHGLKKDVTRHGPRLIAILEDRDGNLHEIHARSRKRISFPKS